MAVAVAVEASLLAVGPVYDAHQKNQSDPTHPRPPGAFPHLLVPKERQPSHEQAAVSPVATSLSRSETRDKVFVSHKHQAAEFQSATLADTKFRKNNTE